MVTVVIHTESNKRYILVGTGYGTYVKTDPSTPFGFLLPYEETGEIPVAALCDSDGLISWFPTNELRVIQADGMNIADIFSKIEDIDYKPILKVEKCPACNHSVTINDKICPSCGITLIK
ncbi:MAG: hypothetical protein AB7V16_00900 [Vulcanibacillus sp.]